MEESTLPTEVIGGILEDNCFTNRRYILELPYPIFLTTFQRTLCRDTKIHFRFSLTYELNHLLPKLHFNSYYH